MPDGCLLPPPRILSVSAGYADLPLTTAANRQTLVNAQSARVVNLGAAGTASDFNLKYRGESEFKVS